MTVKMNIKIGTYKFGKHEANGWTLAFNTEACECCGTTMMAANSIKIATADIEPLGLMILFTAPEEGGYSETFGGSTCPDCDDHEPGECGCPGHESTDGPAGISVYCDGTCR